MKRAQVIGLAVAGTAGLGAFFLMKAIVPKEKVVKVDVAATEVLVASAEIKLGELANENQFRWDRWPTNSSTAGYITRAAHPDQPKQFHGAIARAPILAGEPLTQDKLIKPGQGGVLAAILPAGMRAISTKIKEDTAAGRLILPNDRVDVILTRQIKRPNGEEQHVSDVIFKNVRVLAIGQSIQHKEGKKASEESANTATLELSPQQAEDMALANASGEISLALRSIADLATDGLGPSSPKKAAKNEPSSAIHMLRYGTRERAMARN